MKVKIDGKRAILCDGCGTRLDGRENANKSLASYGSGEGRTMDERFPIDICRVTDGKCLRAQWDPKARLSEAEALARYEAERSIASSEKGR